MIVDKTAWASLEIEKIFALIRRDCRTDLGARRMARALPASSVDELKDRRALFEAVEAYRDRRGELPWNAKLSSIEPALDEARSVGMMTGSELVSVRRLMIGASALKDAIAAAREDHPGLAPLSRAIRDFASEIEALSSLDEEGRFYDSASDRLRRLRERARTVRETIRRKANAILSDPSLASMLQERVVSLRAGRHALLVRQDAISSFPGAVMDRSSSGNSVYMEPHALVSLNNEFALIAEDERAEERRLLHKLTERVLSREAALRDAEDALGEVDLFYALSERMRRDLWHLPIISREPMFDLRKARHPMLGASAVAIDISCGEDFRSLIVTGPNTGGKTVALKTAAVCVVLAWYGWPIPAGDGSIVGRIDDVFADIGDEQSIEQNLSTFSAHIDQIKRIVAAAGSTSLVCLDELGAGTDPDEGAAIGIGVLDALRDAGSLVLATTHHNPIKRYALTTEGVESASVEFDGRTLTPTYRLLVGIPGRSNALLIAERLGLPSSIIERAKRAMHGHEVYMEDLIGELHEKRAAIERENAELERMREKLAQDREAYDREVASLESRRDKLIADADKKAVGIVRNAEASAKSLIKTIEAEARGAANRKYEKSKRHFEKIEQSAEARADEAMTRENPIDSVALAPGDQVVVIGTTTISILDAIDGEKAVITSGQTRVELPLKMIRRATSEESRDERKAARAAGKKSITLRMAEGQGGGSSVKLIAPKAPVGIPSSIMIRGMTLDEALPIASGYLDKAYRAGYGEVTIIHGRGEGILRREVHALCASLPYVASYRLGEPGEGGHGVTVIRFK